MKTLLHNTSNCNPIHFIRSAGTILFFVSLILANKISSAQMVVTPSIASDMVTTLLGCGSAASNITLTCSGSVGYGKFNGVNSNIGIDSGVILTSGNISSAVGPNLTCANSNSNNCPGDAQLTALSGFQTYDASVLEFDVLVNTDTLRFNYVFASDEYPEWVGSIVYNDIFALWLSGPGIVGQVNLATIPGTGTPVSINNVNCVANNSYYICNDPNICFFGYPGGTICPASSAATTVSFDGFTKVLEAKHVVQMGQTYHLKLAIADCSDAWWDSGIFIQANFLSQFAATIVPDPNMFIDPIDSVISAVEGCTDGAYNLYLNNTSGDTIWVPIGVGGTAIEGTDYLNIPDSLMFLPGDTMKTIQIVPTVDGITEGIETVYIYTFDPCTGLHTDSVIIEINDDYNFIGSNDTLICMGDSAAMNVTFSPWYDYQWTPSNLVTCDTCFSTFAIPLNDQQYIVQIHLGSCIKYDTINVNVDVLNPDAGLDQDVCHGDTTLIVGVGGVTYQWSPALGLADPNSAVTQAFPMDTTTYVLTVTGNNPQCHAYDSVTINIVPNLIGFAGNDTIVCSGSPVQLWAAGGDYYHWYPSDYLDNDSIRNPVSTPDFPSNYEVVITNIYGCVDTVPVFVDVYQDPPVTLNQAYIIYLGESAQMFAHGGEGSTYRWMPSDYLTDVNIYNPMCTLPQSSKTYWVTITTEHGCIYYDSTSVTVIANTLIAVPNAFSPNGDGLNETFMFIPRGPFTFGSMKVFNRWGETVFFSSNPDIGWDGKIQSVDAEIGTYVYVIVYQDFYGVTKILKGNVTLLR